MLKVFFGSFFIQSSWSFEKMQTLGFAAALRPALKELYADDAAGVQGALRRHLNFYNAHPYMASPILGAVIKIEEKARAGECGDERALRFKSMVMAPFSALGDLFFWGSLRPLASSAAVIMTVFWGIWGPLLFLVMYNFFHLWMRYRGLKKGYELGEGVAGYITSLRLARWSGRVRSLATAILGFGGAAAALKIFSVYTGGGAGLFFSGAFLLRAAPVAAVALASAILLKRGFSIPRLVYIFIPPLIVYGVLTAAG